MPYCHFTEDPDYDGPARCAECGREADRPYTCDRCAHERATEGLDDEAAQEAA